MKILVYGAGVIGCQLAHMLSKGGNQVTLLARGAWKAGLDRHGLIIRHYAQLHTTIDRLATIDRLEPEQVFDLIFVTMQAGQLPEILPWLAKNHSRYIVFVGNDPYTEETFAGAILNASVEKEIAFGFQGTGGRRESDRVVSVHAGVGMTVGGLHGPLSTGFRETLEKAFDSVKYRLSWEDQMDAWLKCHLVLILPVCYVCYAVDGKLPKASAAQRRAILDAAYEGCVMLRRLNVPIRTADSEDYFRPGSKRRKMAVLLYILAKTPLGRLAASDHALHAVGEMRLLDSAFEELRARAELPMPQWEALRASMPAWEVLEQRYSPA